jgi:hypothetical protein
MNNGSAYDSVLTICCPLVAEEPPIDTIEIGLTLAGAMSAGAYTASGIDFLVEALDSRTEAKVNMAQDLELHLTDVPQHHVRLKVMPRASAEAITAAIATAALRYKFPHCAAGAPKLGTGEPTGDSLYDIWVSKIDISKQLKTDWRFRSFQMCLPFP